MEFIYEEISQIALLRFADCGVMEDFVESLMDCAELVRV